jgi:2-oxoglutarate ferredoxin oxidoreductase subunit delta
VKYCPKKILEMGTERNKKGHFFVITTDEEKCTSCAICAAMCPEAAIEITKEDSNG